MRPRPPSREPKSGPPLGRLRATPYRFRHTLQRVGSGTGSHHGRASSRCRPAALRYRDPRPIKIRAPAHDQRRSEPMARRWAPNDGGDSDDSGEPGPSAGRQTPAPHSVGFDDSWKVGNRNATGSGFRPGEFGAIPPFQPSREPIPMPGTEPPRRSRFISASCASGSRFGNRGLDRGVDLLGKSRVGSQPGCRLEALGCSDGK